MASVILFSMALLQADFFLSHHIFDIHVSDSKGLFVSFPEKQRDNEPRNIVGNTRYIGNLARSQVM